MQSFILEYECFTINIYILSKHIIDSVTEFKKIFVNLEKLFSTYLFDVLKKLHILNLIKLIVLHVKHNK